MFSRAFHKTRTIVSAFRQITDSLATHRKLFATPEPSRFFFFFSFENYMLNPNE